MLAAGNDANRVPDRHLRGLVEDDKVKEIRRREVEFLQTAADFLLVQCRAECKCCAGLAAISRKLYPQLAETNP